MTPKPEPSDPANSLGRARQWWSALGSAGKAWIVIAAVFGITVAFFYIIQADDALSDVEREDAIYLVEIEWGDCLTVAGTDTDGATARLTSADETGRPIDENARPALVELVTGEQFIVQLDGPLKGVATANRAANELLDSTLDSEGVC